MFDRPLAYISWPIAPKPYSSEERSFFPSTFSDELPLVVRLLSLESTLPRLMPVGTCWCLAPPRFTCVASRWLFAYAGLVRRLAIKSRPRFSCPRAALAEVAVVVVVVLVMALLVVVLLLMP